MNKILLSGLAGLVVINAAIAAPTVEQRRAMCEDFGDVWVESTEACIPQDPCTSDDETIRNTYCNAADDKYPLESAEYRNYADCVAENPSDEVNCVTVRTGITYAVAAFPTTEQKSSTWWNHGDAWSQIGTEKALSWNRNGSVTEYNPDKPIPGSSVCQYNFRAYNDFFDCTDPE